MTKDVNEIITSSDIQVAYTKLYACMMNYLWDFNTVKNLANLEIAIYKRFPDKEEMEKYINLLEHDIDDTFNNPEYSDSEDFKKRFNVLKDYIENYDDTGYDIYTVESRLDLDAIKGEAEEVDSEEANIFDEGVVESGESKKKKFKIGKIIKK